MCWSIRILILKILILFSLTPDLSGQGELTHVRKKPVSHVPEAEKTIAHTTESTNHTIEFFQSVEQPTGCVG
jgi:hypothetical protein